jgi:MFS family permease
LWLGQLCSQFGDRLTQLTLVALVAARAPGSALTLAKVLVVTSLPALLMNSFAGAYVDRWNRKRTMIACDVIRAGILALLPWVAQAPSAVPFYGAVFLVFAVATFFVPARLAMIPDIVTGSELPRANALFTSSGMIGSTVILLAGALLVEWIGPAKSCLVNAASYLASAALIVPIRGGRKPAARGETPGKILREVAEGFQELWRHPKTRRAAGLLGFLMAGSGGAFVAAAILVQRKLGSVTKDIGFLSLWLGVGMLLGSLAYGRWGALRSRRKVLGFSFLGCGAGFVCFVAAVAGLKSGVYACASGVLMGFWISPVGTVANTLVHESHPERLHGRLFGSLGVVVNLSLIASMWLSGWLTERGGHGLFLTAVGALFAAAGIVLLYYGQKEKNLSWPHHLPSPP